MYISRKHNGAGLGDCINQINFFYRLSFALGMSFVYSPTFSRAHNHSYDEILGTHIILEEYRTFEQSGIVENCALKDLINPQNNWCGDKKRLLLVEYDYFAAQKVFSDFNLCIHPSFPWLDYFANNPIEVNQFDTVIHLRLGDSFIYRLDDSLCYDSRNKRFINGAEGSFPDEITLSDLKIIKQVLDDNGTYCIITDGISSLQKTLEWGGQGADRELILKAAHSLYSRITDLFGNKLINCEIDQTVSILANCKKIIYTTGTFAKAVNRNLRKDPAIEVGLHEYLTACSSSIKFN